MDSPRHCFEYDFHHTVFDEEDTDIDYTSQSYFYSPESEFPTFCTDNSEDLNSSYNESTVVLSDNGGLSSSEQFRIYNLDVLKKDDCNGKLSYIYAVCMHGEKASEDFYQKLKLRMSKLSLNCKGEETLSVVGSSELSVETILKSYFTIQGENNQSEEEEQQNDFALDHSSYRSDPCHFFGTPPTEALEARDNDDCQSISTSLCPLSPCSELTDDDDSPSLTPPTSPISSPLRITSPLRPSNSPSEPYIGVLSPIASLRSPVSYPRPNLPQTPQALSNSSTTVYPRAFIPEPALFPRTSTPEPALFPRTSTPEPAAGPLTPVAGASAAAASCASFSPIPRASEASYATGSSSTPVYEPWFEDPDSDFNSISSSYCYDSDFDPPFYPTLEEQLKHKKDCRQKRGRKSPLLTYKRTRWQKPYPRQSMHYAVRNIVARRLTKNIQNPNEKDYEYLIAWEGYSSDENTWEPYSHLLPSCRVKLDEFRERLQRRSPSESSLD